MVENLVGGKKNMLDREITNQNRVQFLGGSFKGGQFNWTTFE